MSAMWTSVAVNHSGDIVPYMIYVLAAFVSSTIAANEIRNTNSQ